MKAAFLGTGSCEGDTGRTDGTGRYGLEDINGAFPVTPGWSPLEAITVTKSRLQKRVSRQDITSK